MQISIAVYFFSVKSDGELKEGDDNYTISSSSNPFGTL